MSMSKKRKFCDAWMHEDAYKDWLSKCRDDPYKAKCLICDRSFSAEISSLKRHKDSHRHISNMSLHEEEPADERESFQTSVMKAEVKIGLFCADRNISFLTVDYLVDLMKDIAPDSKIIQSLRLLLL